MPNNVVFDEEDQLGEIPQPELRPPSFADSIIKSGVVTHPGDAAVILGLFALLLIGFAFYLIASSVAPPPQLGNDVLRPGERPPQYISE